MTNANEPTMQAHEVRLNYLERQFTQMTQAVQKLADDMHKIAMATAARDKDREALRRAFEAIEKVKSRCDRLETQLTRHERDRLQEELNKQTGQLESIRHERRAILLKAVGYGAAMLLAIIAAHFGIRFLP